MDTKINTAPAAEGHDASLAKFEKLTPNGQLLFVFITQMLKQVPEPFRALEDLEEALDVARMMVREELDSRKTKDEAINETSEKLS